MGNAGSASTFFPTSVLDCASTEQSAVGSDGRYDYECTQNESVRSSLGILHLLALVIVIALAMLLYLVILRVCARRLYMRERQPLRRLPLAELGRQLQTTLARDYARVSGEACLPPPPRRRRRTGNPTPRTAFDRQRRITLIVVREQLLQLEAELCAAVRELISPDERRHLSGGLAALAPTLNFRWGVASADVQLLAEAFAAARSSLLAEPAWYDAARTISRTGAPHVEEDDWHCQPGDDRFTDDELARVHEAAERCMRQILGGRHMAQSRRSMSPMRDDANAPTVTGSAS